jgi:hypothetical protein
MVKGIVLKAAYQWGVIAVFSTIPLGNHTVYRPSVCVWLRGQWLYVIPCFVGELLNWGLWEK